MHRDPIKTYIRIVEDLERMVATAPPTKPLDLEPVWEIKEVKEELSNHGYVYLDGYERSFRLVPAIRKCYRCGKIITSTASITKECKHRTE
ncbi:MAG TPA: hypothetical protein VJ729_14495 [Nitrososphaeraceae archaeon]|nr:hypothetical protein [Nitrososphaeraceae archaeon]